MNEAIYQFAGMGHTIRLIIQKKPDGDFILGISNGKDPALICQGTKDAVDAEFEAALPGYFEKLKAAAIEAQLNAVDAPEDKTESEDPDYDNDADDKDEKDTPVAVQTTVKPTTASRITDDQPELDFGF